MPHPQISVLTLYQGLPQEKSTIFILYPRSLATSGNVNQISNCETTCEIVSLGEGSMPALPEKDFEVHSIYDIRGTNKNLTQTACETFSYIFKGTTLQKFHRLNTPLWQPMI